MKCQVVTIVAGKDGESWEETRKVCGNRIVCQVVEVEVWRGKYHGGRGDSVESQLTKCCTGFCIPYVLSLVFQRMYTFLNSLRT